VRGLESEIESVGVILAYLDDSGNTGLKLNDPTQPKHYVGALLVMEAAWRPAATRIAEVVEFAKTKGAKPPVELHGAKAVSRVSSYLEPGSGWRQDRRLRAVHLDLRGSEPTSSARVL